jgi:5'-nucleotidase
MPNKRDDKLVIAISSRTLSNLDDSHQVYEQEGLDAYSKYQVAKEQEPLEPVEAGVPE